MVWMVDQTDHGTQAAAATRNPEPRKHHFNPKCYLAGFTENGEQSGDLWVTDLKRQKRWESTPVNAAHRRDYYRLRDENVDPLMVEKAFANIEDVLAPLLKSLFNDPRLPTDQELRALMYFVAIQFIRVPAYRPMLERMTKSIHRDWLSKALRTRETWAKILKNSSNPGVFGDYEEMLAFHRDVIEPGKYSISGDTDWYMQKGFKAVINAIVPSLSERLWGACISRTGSFIGSDSPVMMDGPSKQMMGFKSAEIVLFPVNRYLLLYGTNVPVERERVTRNLVARHNTFMMLTAYEQLYSHTPDFCWMDENGKYQTDWRLFSKEKLEASIKTSVIEFKAYPSRRSGKVRVS